MKYLTTEVGNWDQIDGFCLEEFCFFELNESVFLSRYLIIFCIWSFPIKSSDLEKFQTILTVIPSPPTTLPKNKSTKYFSVFIFYHKYLSKPSYWSIDLFANFWAKQYFIW
jgi:hypothetical protein